MKRTIVDQTGPHEVDIPADEAAALQASWAAYTPPPPPPLKTLAELEAQLNALAAQIAAMKQST